MILNIFKTTFTVAYSERHQNATEVTEIFAKSSSMLKRYKGKVTDHEIEGIFLSSLKMSGGIDFSYVAVSGNQDQAKKGFTFVVRPTSFFIWVNLLVWIGGLIAFFCKMYPSGYASIFIWMTIIFNSCIQLFFYFLDKSTFKREVVKLYPNAEI